jgi:Tol biopolymer transport system component
MALRRDFFGYLSVTPGPQRVSFGREQFSYVRWAGPGRVVLTRLTGNRYDLWSFDVATGLRRRLTDTASSERHPCWSPAAGRFAAFSDRDGEWNLWSFDAEGRDWRQITTGKTGGMYPEWTPDGRYIVFEATRDGIYGVWVAAADASSLRRLRPGITRFPAVSPDGNLVACQFEEDKRWLIGTFRLSTGQLEQRWSNSHLFAPPRWQADGSSLLWVQRNGPGSDLITSNPKPRVLRRLDEQGSVDSFDVDRAGAIAYVTGVRQGDVVRLNT